MKEIKDSLNKNSTYKVVALIPKLIKDTTFYDIGLSADTPKKDEPFILEKARLLKTPANPSPPRGY